VLLLISRRRVLEDIMVNKHKAYRRKNESIIIFASGGSFLDGAVSRRREKRFPSPAARIFLMCRQNKNVKAEACIKRCICCSRRE